MNPLIINLNEFDKFRLLKDEIIKKRNISLTGLTDSSKAQMVCAITQNFDSPSVVVCTNMIEANKFIQDLKFFASTEILYYPAKKLVYYDIDAESKEIENQRLYVTRKILNNEKHIIVTTVDAFLSPMFIEDNQKNENFVLEKGQNISLKEVTLKLSELGFERADIVDGSGQFAIRGGILDLFDINNEYPYRIEFFGDEIDSIRTFDAITQRSLNSVDKIELSFATENILNDVKIDNGIKKLNEILNREDIHSDLKNNISEDIEKIQNGNFENVFDKYYLAFENDYHTFLELLNGYSIFINEPEKCRQKAYNMCYENVETLKVLAERNYIYIPYTSKYLEFEQIEAMLENNINIYMQSFKLDSIKYNNRSEILLEAKEFNFYKTGIEILLNDVKIKSNRNIVLVFPTAARVEQIKNYLIDNNIKVEVLSDISVLSKFGKEKVYIVQGILSGGYEIEEFNQLVIAEPVSGINTNKSRRAKNTIGQAINSFEDLKIGDYIVHENHGIGIYKGIENINVQDIQKDYIKIEYADNGMLYVPISQLDSVKRYVVDEDTTPKVNSLATKEWSKTKTKVSEHVKKLAKELITLYAKREKMKGFAFPKDVPWQKEFEDSFEYELTNDQKVSVQEIKADMEDEKPMDRLLCGDVGYGKTEVALRAAFKAVMGGKQVAYLVPTTVLALQQYKTFSDRMKSFGLRVEMLSRFKTQKEQTKILKDLIDGNIDIIVGTHRLISKDVFFKDLGLLIIDEEHRFGVKAKETIKQLKEQVDVLSMTATPIPRTLHMSMIGIRSMSTLNEPPMERLPVHTYVMEYDENIIKEAIEKEMLRDGQVFYINNRVENIEEITNKVRNLVPEARIAFAHGQMAPDEIENVMMRFMNHELDVIVCTTILENGIDIPNANTIIVENSDRLGLAQLYQIRGRVGRSNRLAYAYITYKKNKQISEISEKRLKAIKDFTEFGSGYKIAKRDLEIRGAGNMLGKEQHGHMAKVGYELYLAMLEKAISDEKNDDLNVIDNDIQKEVKIEIDVSAYISDEYIKNPIQKISMYQKISNISSKEELIEVVDELLDRYGDIPRETENLIKIVEIRNIARKLKISKIIANKDFIKFEPNNVKIRLTNINSNDILIRVQLELNKLQSLNEKE